MLIGAASGIALDSALLGSLKLQTRPSAFPGDGAVWTRGRGSVEQWAASSFLLGKKAMDNPDFDG